MLYRWCRVLSQWWLSRPLRSQCTHHRGRGQGKGGAVPDTAHTGTATAPQARAGHGQACAQAARGGKVSQYFGTMPLQCGGRRAMYIHSQSLACMLTQHDTWPLCPPLRLCACVTCVPCSSSARARLAVASSTATNKPGPATTTASKTAAETSAARGASAVAAPAAAEDAAPPAAPAAASGTARIKPRWGGGGVTSAGPVSGSGAVTESTTAAARLKKVGPAAAAAAAQPAATQQVSTEHPAHLTRYASTPEVYNLDIPRTCQLCCAHRLSEAHVCVCVCVL